MSIKEIMQQDDERRRLSVIESQKNFEKRSEKLLDILLRAGCVESLEEIREDIWKIGETGTVTGGKQVIPSNYSRKFVGKAGVFLEATWPVYVPKHTVYDRNSDSEEWVPASIREKRYEIEISLDHRASYEGKGEKIVRLPGLGKFDLGPKHWIESKWYYLKIGGEVTSGGYEESIDIENLDINNLRNSTQSYLAQVYKKYHNSENVPHIQKPKAEERIVKAITEGELNPKSLKTEYFGKYSYLLDRT